MLQAFLAWDTSHVLSMGPCCDDHRQPRRCGQSCSPGCTGCHRVTPCLGVADPRGPSRTHLAVVLQRLVRATDPKVRRGHARRHSMRADSRLLDPSPARPTILLPLPTHGRPSPRVVENAPQTASTAPAGADRAPSGASSRPGHPDPPDSRHRRGHSTRPGACPSGRGHSTPSGTAIPSPTASSVPGRTEMSPNASPVPGRCTLRGALGSQATGTASGPVLITVARSDLMTPTCTARRWGSTGRGSGILQVGGTLVQYAQPPTSRSPPSCNRPAQSRSGPDSTSNHDFRVPAREPEGV